MNFAGYFFALFVFLSVVSCSNGNISKEHDTAVRNGYRVLPIASSLVEKFPGWSFISHWNIKNDPRYGLEPNEKSWKTLVYAYGRYEIMYVQVVTLTKNGGQVIGPAGEPEIVVKEISKIFKYDSSVATDFTGFQFRLNGEDVYKVLESGWDFSVVGRDLIRDEPIENIDWRYDYWNSLYPLQRVERNSKKTSNLDGDE